MRTKRNVIFPLFPIGISFGDKLYKSREELSNGQFYELMEKYDGIPAMSQVNAFEFVAENAVK